MNHCARGDELATTDDDKQKKKGQMHYMVGQPPGTLHRSSTQGDRSCASLCKEQQQQRMRKNGKTLSRHKVKQKIMGIVKTENLLFKLHCEFVYISDLPVRNSNLKGYLRNPTRSRGGGHSMVTRLVLLGRVCEYAV